LRRIEVLFCRFDDTQDGSTLVRQAKDFLTGKSRSVQEDPAREMQATSESIKPRGCTQ